MLEEIKRSILYFFKQIQITLRTWRNSAEIARAYASPSRKGFPISQIIKESILWLFVIAVLSLLIITAFYRFSAMRRQLPISKEHAESSGKIPFGEKSLETATGDSNKSDSGKKTASPIDTAAAQDSTFKVVKPEIKKYRYIPADNDSEYCILVVNKASKSLYVLQKHEEAWRVVKEYDIAIGEQAGRKTSAGDKRTPEGNYFIVGRKDRSELASIYGPLAYIIDYPNEEDRREGRTGQGIWIHGTAPDSLPLQTRGCIEMENNNLIELSSILKSGIGTPVVILFNPNLTDIASAMDYRLCEERRRTILRERQEITEECHNLLSAWKSAWERKNIKEYESFYDTVRFNGQGLNWTLWKDRKLRTFDLYDTIAITLENITVTELVEHKMIVKFLQRYRTNLKSIENGKKLSFEKINDLWKITGESTCPKEELLL